MSKNLTERNRPQGLQSAPDSTEEDPEIQLKVASSWYRSECINADITRIDEPHVNDFLQSNIWHVRGRDRDLVVDAGLGVASLRENLPGLFAKNPILVLTHAHLDHVGSAHEFVDRRMHVSECSDAGIPGTLHGPSLAALLGLASADGLPEVMITSKPSEDYRWQDYELPSSEGTSVLDDGDVIDLGDKKFRVMHLPGHSPGSICLYEQDTGWLFTGDVLYEGQLLDDIRGSSVSHYLQSMQRLKELRVSTVFPGHGDPFNEARMLDLISQYFSKREHYLLNRKDAATQV